ncbi:TrmH family RNA methyltransferase [Runella sp. MFBS21]|uniref:TrmH family RNA methyltransferase n=1 Tax=Runella sp. MFBS21 TaxID=3034018 RepID=UPI0023FA14FE|nr:TrmH family RNA methyltransferase [Runella sp. MFBS21]MDF7822339.1 TrmH family RNA methyltransferase [Runella sp. MFBS21]
MEFNTVINLIHHPRNIGMITRSHVAFGGGKLIFLGYEKPWEFCDEASAYATNLQNKCSIMHFMTLQSFVDWSKDNDFVNYAIEISDNSKSITGYNFTRKCNFIFGNEFTGLSQEILSTCSDTLVIPQFGLVGSLNVAVAASISFYEFTRGRGNIANINNNKFIE